MVVCLDSSNDAGVSAASGSMRRRSQPQFESMDADNEPDGPDSNDDSFDNEGNIDGSIEVSI